MLLRSHFPVDAAGFYCSNISFFIYKSWGWISVDFEGDG